MLSEKPHKAQINEWATLKETKYARAECEDEIEKIKNEWAIGAYTNEESIDATSQLNAEAQGRLRGLFFALDFLTKDEDEEENNEE